MSVSINEGFPEELWHTPENIEKLKTIEQYIIGWIHLKKYTLHLVFRGFDKLLRDAETMANILRDLPVKDQFWFKVFEGEIEWFPSILEVASMHQRIAHELFKLFENENMRGHMPMGGSLIHLEDKRGIGLPITILRDHTINAFNIGYK